jgi:hypothetical protein
MVREKTLQPFKAMALALILAANVFLFVPCVLYIGNLNEFVVSLPTILASYISPVIFLVVSLAFVGALIPTSVFSIYLVFLGTINILVWLQGNILVWEYGLLDGQPIDWAEASWRGWIDLGIWITLLTILLLYHNRTRRPVIYVATAIFLLQLTSTTIMSMQVAPELSEKSGFKTSASALNEIYRFSASKNVVHLVMDGFQSDLFEEILNEDENGKRIASALDGFVFFKEHMGAFPYTHMSIPAIVSGKIYQNHIPSSAFLEEAMSGKTIVSAAHNAGYEIDLITPGGLLYNTYSKMPHTNAYIVPQKNHVTVKDYERIDAAKLIDLTLFRITPHFIKKYVYNDQRWLVQSALSNSSEFMQLQFFAHKAVLDQFEEYMTVDRSVPVYKFFHLMLVHKPMVTNKNCEYAGRALPTVRATAKIQAKCSLFGAIKLLEKMKKLGIYEDALIILMADHGVWVPPAGLKQNAVVRSNGQKVALNPAIVAQALPLMAIKRPGAKGPLQISRAPSWIVDTAPTIASILNFDEKFNGVSMFDIKPDEQRERNHYFYQYDRREWEVDYLNSIQKFTISGSVFDTGNWHPGERLLPGES